MLFEFKIYNKELIKVNNQNTINTDRYNKCKFYFQEEIWKDKEIYITFIDERNYSQIMMLGKWNEVLTCSIPKEFLEGQYFKIFAYSDNLFKTNTIKINTKPEKCNTRRTRHHDAVKYLIDELKQKIDTVIFEDNQLKFYSNDNLVDTIFIDNVDEEIIKQQIEIYFKEFEEKIQAEIDKCITENEIDDLITSL